MNQLRTQGVASLDTLLQEFQYQHINGTCETLAAAQKKLQSELYQKLINDADPKTAVILLSPVVSRPTITCAQYLIDRFLNLRSKYGLAALSQAVLKNIVLDAHDLAYLADARYAVPALNTVLYIASIDADQTIITSEMC